MIQTQTGGFLKVYKRKLDASEQEEIYTNIHTNEHTKRYTRKTSIQISREAIQAESFLEKGEVIQASTADLSDVTFILLLSSFREELKATQKQHHH